MSDRVVIKEVAPRDGLQAQPKHLSLAQRQALIARLAATGVPDRSSLPGIKRAPGVLTPETILMRSKTGSVRRMTYRHPIGK